MIILPPETDVATDAETAKTETDGQKNRKDAENYENSTNSLDKENREFPLLLLLPECPAGNCFLRQKEGSAGLFREVTCL